MHWIIHVENQNVGHGKKNPKLITIFDLLKLDGKVNVYISVEKYLYVCRSMMHPEGKTGYQPQLILNRQDSRGVLNFQ